MNCDLILFNGNLVTLNPKRGRAAAMAISAGRILAVDDNAKALKLKATETRVIDLDGKTITPGLLIVMCI